MKTVYAMLTTPEIANLKPDFRVGLQALRVLKINKTECAYIDKWTVDEYVHHAKPKQIALKVESDYMFDLFVFGRATYRILSEDEMLVVKNVEQIAAQAVDTTQAIAAQAQATAVNISKFVSTLLGGA